VRHQAPQAGSHQHDADTDTNGSKEPTPSTRDWQRKRSTYRKISPIARAKYQRRHG
jgi:hypothetical protein